MVGLPLNTVSLAIQAKLWCLKFALHAKLIKLLIN